MSQKHCLYCKEIFIPHPRKGDKQETCGKPECRRKRKRETDRKWRAANPTWVKERRSKIRAWAQSYPDYWVDYRSRHPRYVEENRRQTKERVRTRRQMFAKQDVIRSSPIESLRAIQSVRWQKAFAKQDVIRLQLEGILGYLIVRECLQNQPV